MNESIRDLVHPAVVDGSHAGRFKPRLSEEERCCALGLLTLGYTPAVIASMFRIHPRTASQISRKSSVNYRAVRKEMGIIGADAFIEKYVTPDYIQTANSVVSMMLHESTAPRTSPPVKEDGAPNKRSAGREGVHQIIGRSVVIRWFEAGDSEVDAEGWYYIDKADADAPPFGPFKHSKAAYDQAVIDMGAMI